MPSKTAEAQQVAKKKDDDDDDDDDDGFLAEAKTLFSLTESAQDEVELLCTYELD